MEKTKIGITFTMGTWQKRLWFEVPDNEASIRQFYTLCSKIDQIAFNGDGSNIIQKIASAFAIHGFYRIAR